MPPKPPVPERPPVFRPYFLLVPLLSVFASVFPTQFQQATQFGRETIEQVTALLSSKGTAETKPVGFPAGCPDYTTYSQSPHEPRSEGKLRLPNMRPEEKCRTFTSEAVEDLVGDYMARMKDRDLAMLFGNAATQTLDTTIRWLNDDYTFMITGDITAMWLRDSCNQLAHYQSLGAKDKKLAKLIKGAITLQAKYLDEYPYCGSFHAPKVSGIAPVPNFWSQGVTHPFPMDNQTVFECKYELDSIGGFLKLSRQYYENAQDASYLTPDYLSSIDTIFDLIRNQTESTLSPEGHVRDSYAFNLYQPKIPIVNEGLGHPGKETGLVKTAFRPSDDSVIFPYNIPVNALLVVELRGLAKILAARHLRPDLIQEAKQTADRVEKAIWDLGVVDRPGWGKVFAYEIDGFGGQVFMDDANVPSLLSMPYLGFLESSDPVYQNTRKMLMTQEGNPYFAKGPAFYGVGGPHEEGLLHPWPMSLTSMIITSTDDQEIRTFIEQIKKSTSGLGLIHESVYIHDANKYARPWFAWANSYFAEAIMKVAVERPHLLF